MVADARRSRLLGPLPLTLPPPKAVGPSLSHKGRGVAVAQPQVPTPLPSWERVATPTLSRGRRVRGHSRRGFNAHATITASRTRTGAAIGCSALASTATVGQIRLPGICTGCSGDGALKQRTRERGSGSAIEMTRYAELDVTTNFSFLRGGSHAEELVVTAKALGLAAIAVTDRNTLAGVVRAHLAAKEVGDIKFIVGSRLDLDDAPSLLAYPTNRAAYGRLCRLLTLGQRRAEKGKCTLHLADVAAHAEGLIFIALPPDDFTSRGFKSEISRIKQALGPRTRLYLAASHSYRGDDHARIEALAQLTARVGLPLVATNAVLYHASHRRPLQDVLTCIREKCTIHDAGLKLEANAERHLKPPQEMARLFAGHEQALARTIEIAGFLQLLPR